MQLRRRLQLITLVLAVPVMAWAQTAPQVPVTALAGRTAVHAGDRLPLAVRLDVPAGLHVQSDRPHDPNFIALSVTTSPPPGVSVSGLAFPAAKDVPFKGSDQPLSVFEGTVIVGVDARVAKTVPPGTLTIPGRVRYQACNETTCFVPKTVAVTWTVSVVAAGQHTGVVHADVFKLIDFSHETPVPPASTAADSASAGAATGSAAESSGSGLATGSQPTDVLALFNRFTIVATNTEGYSDAPSFVTFVRNAETGVKPRGMLEGKGPIAVLAIVFLGGLALNLTPCVLPMIPINLAIIGAGAQGSKRGRGLLLGGAYGAAMAIVYGVLGLVVILTARTFGSINASPWFNIGIAVLFVALALAMFDVISIDFSRYSSGIRFAAESRGTVALALGMGAVAALLAGACVAPVVIQVVVFSSNLYAAGTSAALALPFVLGLGMALPWPLAGAGIASMPRPGAWMVRVKQALGVFILATAAYYGYSAYEIFQSRSVDPAAVQASVDAQLREGWHASLVEGLQTAQRTHSPVLVDFWATWCKNCLVMDRTTLRDPSVKSALAKYTLVKFQAEDPDASPTRELMQRIGAVGLPAYVILQPRE